MSGKPRLFLLDAGPVIGLHELALWPELLRRAQVVVPSIVATREVIFWDDGAGGVGRPIDLELDATAGRLEIRSADVADVRAVLARFDPVMRQRVDVGEAEALTLLEHWEGDKPELCTADGAAVRAACLLGHADRVVSLEAILCQVGLTPPVLRAKYGEKKVRTWVAAGRQARMRGEGLAG